MTDILDLDFCMDDSRRTSGLTDRIKRFANSYRTTSLYAPDRRTLRLCWEYDAPKDLVDASTHYRAARRFRDDHGLVPSYAHYLQVNEITVGITQTRKEVQQDIADYLNENGAGLTATSKCSRRGDVVYLTKEGHDVRFALTDRMGVRFRVNDAAPDALRLVRLTVELKDRLKNRVLALVRDCAFA